MADVVPYLRCPVCHRALGATAGGALACPARHSFDPARQGYVQLAAGPLGHDGDSAVMVDAREAFLARGHFDFFSAALAGWARSAAAQQAGPVVDAAVRTGPVVDAAVRTGPAVHAGAPAGPAVDAAVRTGPVVDAAVRTGLVVDAGAGTGRHLAAVLDALPAAVGLALDASRPALRRAARAHARAGAVRCDVWQGLPVADGRAELLLSVFAPRNATEFARVLRPGGALLVVTPTQDHLKELVTALDLLRVDPDKQERTAASLGHRFRPYGQEVLVRTLALCRSEVAALVGMGPSAWHARPAVLAAAIERLPEPVRVTASVRLTAYRLAAQVDRSTSSQAGGAS